MNMMIIFIYIIAAACLIFSILKDRTKTKQALIVSIRSFLRILPAVVIIIIFIGLLLGFLPSGSITNILGEQSGLKNVGFIALFGAVLHIPALVAFPLASSLLESGASITAVAAFITTLTMIGVVTLPLEIKELGKKIAFLRNGISFIIAIAVALIMGVVL